MAWSTQGKTAVLKLIKENFLRQFVQPTLNLIGSFEIDAIICLTVGSEQLVIKLQERLKHNHFDRIEIRSNGEPSLLREYLAGSAAVPKPKANHSHAGVTRKRKAGDENENTIYTSDKRVQHADQFTDLLVKIGSADDQEDGDNPLNLSERCRDSYQTRKGQGSLSSGKRENVSSRGPVVGQFSCGLCLLKCNSYSLMQDHFVDIHSCNLRFICSECSTAFAEDDAYSRHCAKHSRQILGAANRRKQAKPRKGAAASEFSDGDDNIPENSVSDQNRVLSANGSGPRNFVSAAVTYSGDQSNGIVRSLLQKQSPLSVANVSEHLYVDKHSTPYSTSPLDLATRDTGDAGGPPAEFRCPHCDVLLLSWSLYNEHCKQVHKRFACNVCLQTFTQRVNRDRHHYSHTGEKPFECGQCGLGFTRRDALKKHQARANHTAPSSSRGTPQQASLTNPDQSDDSADEDVPSMCGVLDYSEVGDCQSTGQITEEVLDAPLPTKSKNFPISSGSKFKKCRSEVESSSLAEDRELSDEVSEHSFHSADNVCLKGFSDLAGAQGVDAGHRPTSAEPSRDDAHRSFKCDSCQESVIGTAAYQDHCKVRHRRTPCTFCGKTFSQKGNMERHMRQHTGERPFQCQFCSSSYTRKETLKTHVNQAHSQQVNQELENNL